MVELRGKGLLPARVHTKLPVFKGCDITQNCVKQANILYFKYLIAYEQPISVLTSRKKITAAKVRKKPHVVNK
jgi:hypothetical protein